MKGVGTVGGLLVRGGSVIDGTGGAAFPGDVRVHDGRVVEVGRSLRPDGEDELDASGAFVTPGFIDTHTHFDPSVFWEPSADPMPQHGVTTVLTGNCSLSLAPLRAEHRRELSGVFSYIEDLPERAFETAIPWSWETYAEYRDAMGKLGFGVNVAPLGRSHPVATLRHGARRMGAGGHRRRDPPTRRPPRRLFARGCVRTFDVVLRPRRRQSPGALAVCRRRRVRCAVRHPGNEEPRRSSSSPTSPTSPTARCPGSIGWAASAVHAMW